jgi:membrane-bound inhibitor of C-type lysozyme
MLLPACLSLLLAGCGGFNIWPFGSSGEIAPAAPPNSTEYRCTGGKGFYLRFLDKGAAWVIFPDREFRLDAITSGPGTRFSNGIATLEINGNEATLTDGPSTTYAACTPVAAKGR